MRVFVVGATGSGKSEFGLALAQRLGNCEIVNSDALQLYETLSIGTAKLPLSERRGIVHHMIDVADGVNDVYDVARYSKEALACVEDVERRGKTPIVVGGSLYYVESLLLKGNSFEDDDEHGDGVTAVVEALDGATAHAALSIEDKATADTLHANDERRVKNALVQIRRRNGEKLSDFVARSPRVLRHDDALVFWMRPPYFTSDEDDPERGTEYASALRRRIEGMLESGLLEEAKRTLDISGTQHNKGALQAIGYKEFAPFFDETQSLSECVDRLVSHHAQYGKYQLKWIRKRLLKLQSLRVCEIRDRGEEFFSGDGDIDLSDVDAFKGVHLMIGTTTTTADDQRAKHYCDTCDLVVHGAATWRNHVSGRRHRRAVENLTKPSHYYKKHKTIMPETHTLP